MVIDIPALHRMEYIYSLIINNIVKDFKRAAIPVKSDKQIFVFVLPLALIKPTIIFDSIESPPNVRLAYMMLESRGIELNNKLHVSSILPAAFAVQPMPGAEK
jgi:hypothetical protein